jgi:outer membrane autotransporter protein
MTMFVAAFNVRGPRAKILAGATFAVLMSASTAAMADCSGTGALAAGGVGGITPFLPFSSGGAVNSLVSAINTVNTAFLTQSTAFISAPANPAPNQEGGGVWARGVGGEMTTKTVSVTSNVQALGAPVPGTITCNNTNHLSFAGGQVGTDMAHLNVGGWNFHIGTTAGFVGAKSKDTSSAGPLNPLGGTFQDSLEVPFVGVYAAATRGGFFIDGQLRTDFYQNTLNDPMVSALYNQRLDARGVAFSGNVGYNQPLQNNWFIEPSAGIVVSRVKVDPLSIIGTGVVNGGLVGTLPGTLHVNDINSTLGRLGVRAGTVVNSGNIIWQPFVTLGVYHEFNGSITSTFDGLAVTQALGIAGLPSGSVSSTNIGTYGQVGVGLAAQIVNTGWLGYVRADYRDGDNIQGYSVNGGIRYQFTPEMIASPRLYTKAVKAPAPLVQAYNWTGFFVGGSFGALNGRTEIDYLTLLAGAPGQTANPRFAGALGGLQAGYDYQTGKWVFGVEGNINATNAKGGRGCQLVFVVTCEDNKNWIGTATARVGYELWNRSLFYARAGVAFTDTRISSTCNANGPIPIDCPGTDTQTRAGWTIGIGSEFALTRNWTVRGETNYYDLGNTQYNLPLTGPLAGRTITENVHETGFISTVGLNYRFAPGVVVAKY